MLAKGLIDEVAKLYNQGDLHASMPSMRAVGYRQIWQYLDGDISYDEMQASAIAATRQLAKKQLTWLRSWEDITLIQSSDDLLDKILSTIDSLT